MSAETCQRRSISGTLVKPGEPGFLAEAAAALGAISIWSTVSPKVAAQVSKSVIRRIPAGRAAGNAA